MAGNRETKEALKNIENTSFTTQSQPASRFFIETVMTFQFRDAEAISLWNSASALPQVHEFNGFHTFQLSSTSFTNSELDGLLSRPRKLIVSNFGQSFRASPSNLRVSPELRPDHRSCNRVGRNWKGSPMRDKAICDTRKLALRRRGKFRIRKGACLSNFDRPPRSLGVGSPSRMEPNRRTENSDSKTATRRTPETPCKRAGIPGGTGLPNRIPASGRGTGACRIG